jgi:hypothetical protein
MKRSHWFFVWAVGVAASGVHAAEPAWLDLADPVIEGRWV